MINYENVVFLFVRAPSDVVSSHKVASLREHKALIEDAISKGLLLYYSQVNNPEDKQLWILDKSTIPSDNPRPAVKPKQEPKRTVIETKAEEDIVESPPIFEESDNPSGLFCPYCEKPMKSTSGRTLHVKSEHPENYEDYLKKK